jgi:hypothetical protein
MGGGRRPEIQATANVELVAHFNDDVFDRIDGTESLTFPDTGTSLNEVWTVERVT